MVCSLWFMVNWVEKLQLTAMVRYYEPPAVDLSEQQIIMPAYIANGSFQEPFTYNKIVFRRKTLHFDQIE